MTVLRWSRAFTKWYFKRGSITKALNTKTFYPEVTVMFETFDKTHYHVPLLLNPLDIPHTEGRNHTHM